MTDAEVAALGTVMSGAGLTLAGVMRWAVALWATIRREDIAASRESATLKRAADERNVDRQIATTDRIAALVAEHTTKDLAHHAEVKQAVVRLEAIVTTALDWRERTPIIDERPPSERHRTAPRGYRAPKPGAQDDH